MDPAFVLEHGHHLIPPWSALTSTSTLSILQSNCVSNLYTLNIPPTKNVEAVGIMLHPPHPPPHAPSRPHPHPSTPGHIATETALLTTLYKRSKDQHRSQFFLSRLQAVLRLSRLVIDALSSTMPKSRPDSLGIGPSTTMAEKRAARLPLLLPKVSDLTIEGGCLASCALVMCYARLLSAHLTSETNHICTQSHPLFPVMPNVADISSQPPSYTPPAHPPPSST